MSSKGWKWALGLTYILAVASIWIAASFVVQTVVDDGVPPFLITYICNSLFLVYVPLVEIGRYLEDNYRRLCFWRTGENGHLQEVREVEQAVLLKHIGSESVLLDEKQSPPRDQESLTVNGELDSKGRWTRKRVAKVSLLICPFWFLAQLFFNFSLKYTTVTSNTILSSASSLFTFLVSLVYLGERFTWVKLSSVLLCMAGTIIVSLGDSKSSSSISAPNPLLGDILALLSAGLYAMYVTLIGKMLPDGGEKSGQASMAQFLGYLGLFNVFIFLPVALVLNSTNLEPFNMVTWKQLGLIVGKGFLDNVLSDYLWAKAILLTTTTVATAGLTIQVPLAAIVDTVIGNAPSLLDYLGALAVLIGFAGINIPHDSLNRPTDTMFELEDNNAAKSDEEQIFRTSEGSDSV